MTQPILSPLSPSSSSSPQIELVDGCLVVLIGASASGKSSFAASQFLPTETLSSDTFRAMVADDETDQSVTSDAFSLLHAVARARLTHKRTTVVDATNVKSADRAGLVELARQAHVPCVAIVFDVSVDVCLSRNENRARQIPPRAIKRHASELARLMGQGRATRGQSSGKEKAGPQRAVRTLTREGFDAVYVLTEDAVASATVVRCLPSFDRRSLVVGNGFSGFDIIGDIHGCLGELTALLTKLGYTLSQDDEGWTVSHPDGRIIVFVGDLVDRGPHTPEVVDIALSLCARSRDGIPMALAVRGNHDDKLARALAGRDVTTGNGLAESLQQYATRDDATRSRDQAFLAALPHHVLLDAGRLCVAHGGLSQELQGRDSKAVVSFALYGAPTGERDADGLPVRSDWAKRYRSDTAVVYGHTPTLAPTWYNNTINLDTGAVFGGELSALRWPEREVVSVPAARVWYEDIRGTKLYTENDATATPGEPTAASTIVSNTTTDPRSGAPLAPTSPCPPAPPEFIDVSDVARNPTIETALVGPVTVRSDRALPALETMSRHSVDPRWLVYLPPTMSPTDTPDDRDAGLLERPVEAFDYFRQAGVMSVVCEEKHMGSRAVMVLCRNEAVAAALFAPREHAGIIYTRTGRPFFSGAHAGTEAVLVDELRARCEQSGLFDELGDWLVLDCELMPWSAKADDLIKSSYAQVGAAGLADTNAILGQLAAATARGLNVTTLTESMTTRLGQLEAYQESWRGYCWPTPTPAELRLAPFHILAGSTASFLDQSHTWHLSHIDRIVQAPGSGELPDLVTPTPHLVVDLADEAACEAAASWWADRCAGGAEGMVVKPLEFTVFRDTAKGRRLVQPALKVRGQNYLRLIYGPEYDSPSSLSRLSRRSTRAKRANASREYALGAEALSRMVAGDELWRVHQCVFAVLALESEPLDPRL